MRYGPRPKLVGDPDQIDPLLARPPAVETEAHRPRQEDCDICRLPERGCFVHDNFKNRRGIWSCENPECRAEARARAGRSDPQLVAAE